MLNTIFFIALRQLSGRKRQTILTILGISIGSMVLLVTLGIAAGLGVMVSEKLIEVSAQITIKGEKVQSPNSIDLLNSDSSRISIDALSVKSVPRERIEIRPYLQVIHSLQSLITIRPTTQVSTHSQSHRQAVVRLHMLQVQAVS